MLLKLVSTPSLAFAQDELTLPRIEHAARAVAPEGPLPGGVSPVVDLELDVDERGIVTGVRVVAAPNDAWADAAARAARLYLFAPAMLHDRSVRVTIAFRLEFDLNLPAPRLAVEGHVMAAGTRVPVPGLAVTLVGPGGARARAITDEKGDFLAFDLLPGSWTLEIADTSYQHAPVPIFVKEDAVAEVRLYPVQGEPWEVDDGAEVVEVVGRLQKPEVSERSLDATVAQKLPGSNGDVLRAALNLPGLGRPPLGMAQFIVRGTPANATRTYMDGVRLPQAFHFGGVTAVVPGGMLAELRFLPGNFSVRYGDGVGGVVDLVTALEMPGRSSGSVSLDVNQASLFVEQRVGERTALTASVRRSYADAILGPIVSAVADGVSFRGARYYDAQVRVVHRAPLGGFVDATVLVSDDRLRLLQNDDAHSFGLQNQFITANLGYRASMGHGWRSETRVVVGPERQASTLDDVTSFEQAVSFQARQEFARTVPEAGHFGWRIGLDLLGRAFRFSFGGRGLAPIEEAQGVAVTPALYVESTARAGPVEIVTGVRGAVTALADHRSWLLDPRLSMTVAASASTQAFVAVGRFSQFPLPREVLPASGANSGLTPSWSLQSSVGLRQRLGSGCSLELVTYWNELFDLVSGRSGRFEFNVGPPSPIPGVDGPYANAGRGRTFGGEVMFRFEHRRALVWVAASASRSTRRELPDLPPALFALDQTLQLNVLGTYALGKRWTLGGRGRVGSGTPYYPVTNRAMDLAAGAFVPVFATDPERLRVHWSVDLRVDKEWVFKRWALTLYVEAQGITDPKNTELITYNHDYTTQVPFRSLPPLPTFGLKGTW